MISIYLQGLSLGLACFLGMGALMEALPWLQKIILGGGGALVIYIGAGLNRICRPFQHYHVIIRSNSSFCSMLERVR